MKIPSAPSAPAVPAARLQLIPLKFQPPPISPRLINNAIADRPDDMAITVHLCRGNSLSRGHAEGGYEPVAEKMFNAVKVDGFFLEYDSERAGDFQPLRFV